MFLEGRSRRVAALFSALSVALVLAAPVAADDADDHDQARALVEAGAIRALPDIIAGLGDRLQGRVIEVELEHENGRWVYELTVLGPGGSLRDIWVDAVTGAALGGE